MTYRSITRKHLLHLRWTKPTLPGCGSCSAEGAAQYQTIAFGRLVAGHELEESRNPVASLILAHLAPQRTRTDSACRLQAKLAIKNDLSLFLQ